MINLRLLTLLLASLIGAGCEKQDHDLQKAEKPAAKDEHHDEVKLSADAIKKYGITIEPVKRHKLTPTVIAPARVSFNTEAMAHVGAVLRGRVIDLKVKQGDAVNKGAQLLVVESPELGEAQSDFIQKKAALATAAPTVELARSAYERAKSLYEVEKGIALTEVQKRQIEYHTAQGALRAAESAAVAAENKLHLLGMDQAAVDALAKTAEIMPRYTVRAPIAGTVTSRQVTLGELVSPEKDALLVLVDMSTLWIIADVPEIRLREVEIGAPARVKVAASEQAIDGVVSFIEPALDANTRSGRVRVEVKDGKSGLRPGMFAQVEITSFSDKSEPVLAIPDEAVQTVEGSPAVFVPVQGEENTFAKRPVTVGKNIGGIRAVQSGLKEGESIVVKGSFVLKAESIKGEGGHEH